MSRFHGYPPDRLGVNLPSAGIPDKELDAIGDDRVMQDAQTDQSHHRLSLLD